MFEGTGIGADLLWPQLRQAEKDDSVPFLSQNGMSLELFQL